MRKKIINPSNNRCVLLGQRVAIYTDKNFVTNGIILGSMTFALFISGTTDSADRRILRRCSK